MNFTDEYIGYNQGDQDQVIALAVNAFDTHQSLPDLIDQQTESLAWHSHADRNPEVVVYISHSSAYHGVEWARAPIEQFFGNSVIGSDMTRLRWADMLGKPLRALASDLYPFSLEEALQELKEIRQDAEEAYASDNEIDPVPESAYDDAQRLLEILFRCNIPMADIGWAEDGSIGFEWRPEEGIATVGLYGDNLVIYGAFFDNKRQVEGVCALSDLTMLKGFLIMLFPSFNKDLI